MNDPAFVDFAVVARRYETQHANSMGTQRKQLHLSTAVPFGRCLTQIQPRSNR